MKEEREAINKKKEEIRKDPMACLIDLLFKSRRGLLTPEEIVEWAVAFAEYLEDIRKE